ncbi:hypothetical protein ABIF61_000148 [Bradyrhizobium japonicum]
MPPWPSRFPESGRTISPVLETAVLVLDGAF